jgi:hypothetical protein
MQIWTSRVLGIASENNQDFNAQELSCPLHASPDDGALYAFSCTRAELATSIAQAGRKLY